ncbi:hypothetical protein BpHYR1_040928 [Brachionus plicatilis]|uniref:Uncharacterized protein n=1 Tax=Brachionus plicatilis TaxID=10195 RepID=A0A3M7QDA3_BRAPC|nr:hypothetical protein BpHYR1_040928 [Brachionus plicatilis]
MSKAQARGKGKPSNPSNKKPVESKPATLLEIVPGKFNENDWNSMLEAEDSQEFVWELIDEIFDNTLKTINKNYLDNQTIPYTINEARKAMLHILDWQFLSKDKDDDLTEIWVEDTEPDACVIDSWAQGFVDSVQKRDPTPVQSKHQTPQEETRPNFLEELNRMLTKPSSPRVKSAKKEKTPDPDEQKAKKIHEHKSKKKKLDSISRRVLEAPVESEVKKTIPREKNFITEIKKMEEPISRAPVACQSILKTLLSRPLTMREIEIDSDGNVQSIAKLDFDKAPVNNKSENNFFYLIYL